MKKKLLLAKNKEIYEIEMTIEECINHFDKTVVAWAKARYKDMCKLSNNIMDEDDLYNEAMICLVGVYNVYVPKNTFSTALHKSLDNLKVDLLRKSNTKKRKTTSTTVSFDEEIDDGVYLRDKEGCEDLSFIEIELHKDLEDAVAKLPEDEQKIFNFLMNEETTKQLLSEELGISRPTLNTRIIRVKDKMIDLLPEYMY